MGLCRIQAIAYLPESIRNRGKHVFIPYTGETINSESDSIPSLVIEMDWDDDDLKKARDIFEKYDNALQNKASVNWTSLESELCNTFNIVGLWTNAAPISEMICAIKCIKALSFSRFLVS